MSSIPSFITFLISTLADLLTSDLLFPFLGIWMAAYVVYIFFRLMKGGFRK